MGCYLADAFPGLNSAGLLAGMGLAIFFVTNVVTIAVILLVVVIRKFSGIARKGRKEEHKEENAYGYAGKKVVYLGGISERPEDGSITPDHHFGLRSFSAKDIGEFVKACNIATLSESSDICVHTDPENRYSPLMFRLSKYRDYGDERGGMYRLQIYDLPDHNAAAFDPELYSEIEGIRELHVAKAMQNMADDKGIDWYSYWPELEKVVVEED